MSCRLIERHDQIVSNVACITNICTLQIFLALSKRNAVDSYSFSLSLSISIYLSIYLFARFFDTLISVYCFDHDNASDRNTLIMTITWKESEGSRGSCISQHDTVKKCGWSNLKNLRGYTSENWHITFVRDTSPRKYQVN